MGSARTTGGASDLCFLAQSLEAFQKGVWGFVEFNPKKNFNFTSACNSSLFHRGSAHSEILGGSEFPFQCIPHIMIPDSHLPLASPGTRFKRDIFPLLLCVSSKGNSFFQEQSGDVSSPLQEKRRGGPSLATACQAVASPMRMRSAGISLLCHKICDQSVQSLSLRYVTTNSFDSDWIESQQL